MRREVRRTGRSGTARRLSDRRRFRRAGTASRSRRRGRSGGAVGDGALLGNPPIGQCRVFVDQAKQLAPALEHSECAVSGVARDAEIEGLFLPPS